MKLVIVDDDMMIVKGLLTLIREDKEYDNVEIYTAYNGNRALDILRSTSVDIMITDIRMRGMDGLDLIKEVRTQNLCSKIIILTAFEQFDYAKTALKYQVLDYLTKPINMEELRSILNTAIQSTVSQNCSEEYIYNLINQIIDPDIFEKITCSKVVRRILEYIEKNHTKDTSLTELSIKFGLHPNYICALLNKEIGMSFIKYRDIYRIYHAMKIILADKTCTFKQVSFRVGYSSESSFYKKFKTYTSFTPLQFMEKYNNF